MTRLVQQSIYLLVLVLCTSLSAAQEASDEAMEGPPPKKSAAAKKEKSDDVDQSDDAPPASPVNKKAEKQKKVNPIKDPGVALKEKAEAQKVMIDKSYLPPGKPSRIEELFGPPVSIEDYWLAIERDLNFGYIERVKQLTKDLLSRPDLTPEKILDLRDKYGERLLIRLQSRKELQEVSKPLVDLANDASRKRNRDPGRLRKFLRNLGKSASEEAYAIDQLRLAGPYAIASMVEAYKDPANFDAKGIGRALLDLDPSSWPAIACLLDSNDAGLQLLALDSLEAIAPPQAADVLWYVADSGKFNGSVKDRANEVLSKLTQTKTGARTPAADVLRLLAERYYRGQVDLKPIDDKVTVWRWTDAGPTPFDWSTADANAYYAYRAIRQSLELNPTVPAQVLHSSILLDEASRRFGLDAPLPNESFSELETVRAIDSKVLVRVLSRALEEKKTGVVLQALRLLGEKASAGEMGTEFPGKTLISRSLAYPDTRVQFAAAEAALSTKPSSRFPVSGQVRDVLLRALSAKGQQPRAVIFDPNEGRGNQVGGILTGAGYSFTLVRTGKEGFVVATESELPDLLILNSSVNDWPLEQTLANLRADSRSAGIPIIVLGDDSILAKKEDLLRKFKNLAVLPIIADAEKMRQAAVLSLTSLQPISGEAKSAYVNRALNWFSLWTKGAFPPADFTPIVDPIAGLLGDTELGVRAADILAYLPSGRVQAKLADAAMNETFALPNRIAASDALAKNIQHSSNGIQGKTRSQLLTAYEKLDAGELRQSLAKVAGLLNPTSQEVTARLLRSRPATGIKAPNSNAMERPAEKPTEPTPPPAASSDSKKAEKPKEGDKKDEKKKDFFNDE